MIKTSISMQFGFLMDNQTDVCWALNETCVINHVYDCAQLKCQWILEMISTHVLGWTGIRKYVSFGLTRSLWWIMDRKWMFPDISSWSLHPQRTIVKTIDIDQSLPFTQYWLAARHLGVIVDLLLYWKDFEGGETFVKLVCWVNIVKFSGDQNVYLVFSISL